MQAVRRYREEIVRHLSASGRFSPSPPPPSPRLLPGFSLLWATQPDGKTEGFEVWWREQSLSFGDGGLETLRLCSLSSGRDIRINITDNLQVKELPLSDGERYS